MKAQQSDFGGNAKAANRRHPRVPYLLVPRKTLPRATVFAGFEDRGPR
ncbi:MAG: hypothetical protein ACTIDY_16380 [Halomonadaceae bacterium]|uniref:Uncharacterized protein n=1 Tax=Halomonas colorata TaxID=2742615 RepID=A0ABR9G3G5_9GAMM|nr:hypothetical protein [Halomonas colorata]MBE0465419.1 hypothetical protein [Halomonas colorata]